MNMKGLVGAALLAGVAMSSGCIKEDAKNMRESRRELLENVMENKPQRELDSLNRAFARSATAARTQHAIDSIVFRNMFEGSDKLQDSAFVADYKKMMNATRTPVTLLYDDVVSADNVKLKNKLHDVMSVKEIKQIEKEPLMNKRNYFGIGRQYLVDSVYHQKLFEKHGMLDEKGSKLFKDLCKKVRP